MSKKKLFFILLALAIIGFVIWIIIINSKSEPLNYEVITEGDKTIYKIEDVKYQVVDDSDTIMIETSKGLMVADLYPTAAPITVENLKKLISEKFYDGLTFHRVINGFMIQTGDPTATGTGGSEETIKGEFANNGVENTLSHKRGILSMARKVGNPDTEETRNSATSQFFIVQKDTSYLDGDYASFGLLLHGYDVLDSIASVETDKYDKPLEDITIKQIRLVDVYR